MYRVLILLGMWMSACASTTQPSYLVQPEHQPEVRTLPPDPATEALPTGTPANADFVEPQEAGSCVDAQGHLVANASRPCPDRAGILMGETRAAQDGLFRVRYRELRLLYEADRQVWAAQRSLYEGQLQRADAHIQSLRPTWWQQNALGLGIASGFLLGSLTVIAIVAVTHAEITTTTHP